MCCFPDNQCKNGANTNIDNDCQLLIPELLKIAKNWLLNINSSVNPTNKNKNGIVIIVKHILLQIKKNVVP